jgi:hypothetical protein
MHGGLRPQRRDLLVAPGWGDDVAVAVEDLPGQRGRQPSHIGLDVAGRQHARRLLVTFGMDRGQRVDQPSQRIGPSRRSQQARRALLGHAARGQLGEIAEPLIEQPVALVFCKIGVAGGDAAQAEREDSLGMIRCKARAISQPSEWPSRWHSAIPSASSRTARGSP